MKKRTLGFICFAIILFILTPTGQAFAGAIEENSVEVGMSEVVHTAGEVDEINSINVPYSLKIFAAVVLFVLMGAIERYKHLKENRIDEAA